jgi:DNA-binding MarR family transcriptional regulator
VPDPTPAPTPDAAPDPTPVPLTRLFAMATRSLIDELHARLADRGWPAIGSAFGFVLLAAREQPVRAGAIAELLGFSKQAASKLVDAMEGDGYVRRRPADDDGRAKVVELTARGHRLLAAVQEVYAELEDQWAEVLGRARVEALRHDLHQVLLATHGGTLPAIRPTW